MPNIDKKAPFEQIRLYGTMQLTKLLSGNQVIAGCEMTTGWCMDAVSVLTGISVSLQGVEGSGPMPVGTTVRLQIPILGVDVPVTLSATLIHTGAVPYVIEIDDGVLYSMAGGAWRLKFSAMRCYLNGSLVHSEGATTLDNYYHFATAGIPLLGIPPKYVASAAVNPVPILGTVLHSTTPASTESYGTARISDAGWEFKEPGSSEWQDLPVLIDLLTPPPHECEGCESPTMSDLAATRTTGVVVSAEQHIETETELYLEDQQLYCSNGPAVSGHFDVYRTRLTWWGNGSQVTTVPNLSARVKRMGAAHGELVYRGGMPRTRRAASTTCGVDGIGSGVHVTPLLEDVHPRQSRILSRVGNALHPIEDTFGYDVPSPASDNGFRYESFGYSAEIVGPWACPAVLPEEPPPTLIDPVVPEDEVCYVAQTTGFLPDIDHILDHPDMLGYIHHEDPIARYVNYWGSRHWSFFNWFPANTIDTDDDGIPDAQNIHKVFDAPIDVRYWLAKGDQWEYENDLPLAEQTRRRTTLQMAPLLFGAHQGLISSVMGTPTSWWGDETFRVDSVTPLDELEFDGGSSALWTFDDCSGVFGGTGITLTPDPGMTTIKARLQLGTFDEFARLWPHIAKEFEVDWEPGNIEHVLVELVGVSGSKASLTEAPGRFPWMLGGADNKYAGSYKQDLGQFYFDDEGWDLLAAGMSATSMVDPELVHAFSLLAGRTAAELRFTIEVTSDAATCEIKYPVLYAFGSPEVLPENRSNHAVLWPDGPGVRFGNVAHYYSGIVNETPIVAPPGVPLLGVKLRWLPSPIDWVCFKNLVLRGVAHDFGLTPDLNTWFDSEEISGPGDADYRALAVLVPRGAGAVNAALVNGASCPPVCVWPSRARHEDTLLQTGTWALEAWSYAEERRFLIANDQMHLQGPDVYTSPYGAVSGWPIAFHQSPVTNNEEFHIIRHGADDIGTIRPWHGCMVVRRRMSGEVGREPDVIHIRDGTRWEALIIYDEALERDSLIVRRSHGMPVYGFETQVEVANGEEASFPSLAYMAWGRLVCAYTRDGGFRARYSDDDGKTWGTQVSLITPGFMGRIWSNDDGETLAIAFRYNSGSSGPGKLFRRFQGPGDVAMNDAAAIVDSTGAELVFEPEVFTLSWDHSLGAWSLMAKIGGEPGPSRFFSVDNGDSWTKVT